MATLLEAGTMPGVPPATVTVEPAGTVTLIPPRPTTGWKKKNTKKLLHVLITKKRKPFWIDFHCLTRCKMLDGMQPILLDNVHRVNWPFSYKSSFSFFQARLHSIKIDEETQAPEPSKKKEVSLNLRQHPVASTLGYSMSESFHMYT